MRQNMRRGQEMNEQQLIVRCIEAQEASYNPEMHAVTEPFSSPGYHTTLTAEIGHVHKTRTAAYYALALLDSGLPEYRERAYAVLEKLVEAQDVNPDHKTFGIWSWFYEEPLSAMSPPDWNWADFIGKALLLTLKRHHDVLPQDLRAKVEQALRNACQAIIFRNVGPHYTNIAIMGALVTLVSGEWLGDSEVEAYGQERLQRFRDYTMESGTFQEFNSPTYTMIAIEELSHIHTETRNAAAKRLAEQLLDVAWTMVASRFHPRTLQWSGPHTRSYSELLSDEVLSFLQYSLKGRVSWLDEHRFRYDTTWYGNQISCPDPYAPYFVEARTSTLVQPLLQEHSKELRSAVTYMTEDYTLGTMSHSDMWNQRRGLIGYMSTQNGPVYLHLRALRDGYDYTGAMLTAAQQEGHSLFGVHFVTDGGDRHPSLDPIQSGTIQARDLRLRFELGGAIDGLDVRWVSHGDGAGRGDGDGEGGAATRRCDALVGSIPLHIEISSAVFGPEAIRYESTLDQGVLQVDVILYQGELKPIRLAELEQAFVVGQLSIGALLPVTEIAVDKHSCTIRIREEQEQVVEGRSITLPARPGGIGR